MSDKLSIGDVVCIKSGGPRMTIVRFSVGNENIVHCAWFNKDVEGNWTHPDAKDYSIDALRKCEDTCTNTKCCKDK